MFMLQHKCILNVADNFYAVGLNTGDSLYLCNRFTIENDFLSFFFYASLQRRFILSFFLLILATSVITDTFYSRLSSLVTRFLQQVKYWYNLSECCCLALL